MHARLLIAAAGLAVAALALCDPSASAYSTLGGSLDLAHRDLRVFNNYGDAEANSNTASDPNFPGSVGANLAVWKAAVEWGSMLHGSGQGDPTQPFDLGSGGANFDYAWQKNAPGVGTTDDKVNSELTGSSGGVLAFTETPVSDGWRIRYYSGWTWEDGPEAAHPFVDLQGVACHELGHALGLGHSSAGGATMQAVITGNGSDQRSISSDDAAGVQAIYGAKSLSKPRISGYSVQAGVVTVSGANFSSSGNEIWFTRATPQTVGTPVKISGLVSSAGGTQLSALIPAEAAPGDILVRGNGISHASLSNAFPFDPLGTVPPPPAAPQLDSVAPAQLSTYTGGNLSLYGSGFALAKQVQVGTQFVPATGFTVLSDTELAFGPPGALALGPVDVRVWNANGPGNALSFDWTDNAPPQLQPAGFAVSNNAFQWSAGGGAGSLGVLAVTTSPNTFQFDGWPLLTFGVVGAVKPLNALGLTNFSLWIPANTAGVTFYAQIGTLDPLSAAFEGSSTPVATTVLF
jgi:hypothetical protein